MFNLLTPKGARQSASRGIFSTLTDAVRSITAPAALVRDQAQQTPAVAEPDDLFTEADMPELADIERAALSYDLACDNARRADRSKRAAKRILGRLPADGIYGAWRVYRKPSARMTPDLEEIGRILREHGIRQIPMKPCAASLVVERVQDASETTVGAELAGVAA